MAKLIREAAAKTKSPEARARIQSAAESILQGGRAAEPYDHAKAMAEYQKSFRESFPNAPAPLPPDNPRGENDEEETVAKDDEKDAASDEKAAPVKKPGEKRTHPLLLAQLDKIKAEMKRIGFWSDKTEEFQAKIDRGEVKSFMDAPTFELWLQLIFIPHARQWSIDDTLPDASNVGELGRRQYDYMSCVPEAEELLYLLREFDEIFAKDMAGGK